MIPVNRWTVGVAVALTLIFGHDLVEPIFRIVGILAAPYTPAL